MRPKSIQRKVVALVVSALSVFGWLQSALAAPAPAFDLKQWETNERVKLEDFAGQIVVLDFFAYWCVPCQRASPELEEKIQKLYTARKGNAHGIPRAAHSVLTEHFVDEPGHPTRDALDRVLGFFAERLSPAP